MKHVSLHKSEKVLSMDWLHWVSALNRIALTKHIIVGKVNYANGVMSCTLDSAMRVHFFIQQKSYLNIE